MIAAAFLGLLLFGGIGAVAMWLWLRQTTEIASNNQNKISNNNSPNNKNLTENNSINANTTPSVNQADEELTRLRNLRVNSPSTQTGKIGEDWKRRKKKYPTDYRFPFETALLLAPSPSHHKVFHALSEAAATAIKNDQSPQMLSDLMQKKRDRFSPT